MHVAALRGYSLGRGKAQSLFRGSFERSHCSSGISLLLPMRRTRFRKSLPHISVTLPGTHLAGRSFCASDRNFAWSRSLRFAQGLAPLEDFIEYFRLDHPTDRLILCNRSNCIGIADYLEVSEQGGEDFTCAAHTGSERHASVLPTGVPGQNAYR